MDKIQIQAWSLQRSELFTVTRQVALLNCVPGAKSAIADALLAVVSHAKPPECLYNYRAVMRILKKNPE